MRLNIQILPVFNCLHEIGAQVATEGAGVILEALEDAVLGIAEVEIARVQEVHG